MSRLQDELQKRREPPKRTPAEEATIKKYQDRISRLRKLVKNKDFEEYLKLEEEMNDPRIVIAHRCTDATCEALKHKIREYWKRQQVMKRVQDGL